MPHSWRRHRWQGSEESNTNLHVAGLKEEAACDSAEENGASWGKDNRGADLWRHQILLLPLYLLINWLQHAFWDIAK